MTHLIKAPLPASVFEQRALQVIATRRSPRTREAYAEDLQRWLTFCTAMHVNPAQPPILAVTTFRDHLIGSFAPSSCRRILAALSSTYGGLRRFSDSGVTVNPFHPLVLPWPPAPAGGKTTAVTEADAEAMIAVCAEDEDQIAGTRDAAVLRLLYDLGLRRASVARMARAGIRTEGRRTLVRVVVKGGREEEVSLPLQTRDALTAHLARLEPTGSWVFPNTKGAPMHPNTINLIVSERAQQAGVNHVHPHAFRAAFVTAAYDAELPEREIQAAVHHADPKVTRQYDRGRRGLGVADAVAAARKPLRNK